MKSAAKPRRECLDREGYLILPKLVSEETLTALLKAVGGITPSRRSASLRGVLRSVPVSRAVLDDAGVLCLLTEVLGARWRVVRSILFDKTPSANWKVAWHQDLSIAVRERADVPGYGPWSQKDGVVHVEPPAEVLGRMVTLRLHLDHCSDDNGPLRVLPGSHAHGRLSDEQVTQIRASTPEETCIAPAGGAVVMKPLLLHASSAAQTPRHRRVLHLECTATPLPAPLAWAESFSPT